MGIRGLTSYINGNPRYLEPYELKGGYLIIDGMNSLFEIFLDSRCICSFGGDPDDYAQTVGEFFDDLLKCGVTPLVVLDGGMEQKKFKTQLKRMRNKLQIAKTYGPSSEETLMPFKINLAYFDILIKKSIKMCRAVFEADADMAGLAKALDCPVLSNDSDFYLFGVSYIPISTLERFPVKINNVYVKRCKIYRAENLLHTFPGLDASVFSLAAVLLGNDYIEAEVFKGFLESLGIFDQNERFHQRMRKIHLTLHWLKNYELNDAVAAILSKLRKKHRRKALDIIELVVKGYMETSCELLVPLGFEDLYHEQMSRETSQKFFKFEGDIDALESARVWEEETVPERESISADSENSRSDEDTEEETCEYGSLFAEKNSNTKIEKTWPSWFFQRYSKGEFSANFVDMMALRLYTTWARIEDFNYTCVSAISFEILRVIDGLLVSGRSGDLPGLTFFARDGNDYSIRRSEEVLRGTRSVKFPSLEQLEDTKMDIKKRIIDDTLGIDGKEHLLQDLPPKWRLYVATIFYWMKSCEEPPRNSCHLYAILLAMLIGVIDQKIGYHRSEYSFKRSFGQKISDILSERQLSKSENPENVSIRENSMIEALEAVTADDCLIAAPFFISQRLIAENLIEFPEEFNVTIVHIFSQFQACFDATIQLNSLLGYPYERPNISEFYNGTMLYNLYTNFEKVPDVEAHIDETLENSPTLSNLMKLLITKMKSILQNGCNNS